MPKSRNIAEGGRLQKEHQRNYLLKHQAKDKWGKELKQTTLLSLLNSEREREISTLMHIAPVNLAGIRKYFKSPELNHELVGKKGV